MKDFSAEKREHKRHSARVDINFQFAYDVKAKLKFQRSEGDVDNDDLTPHSAVSQNVSSDGLCFISDQKLEKGAPLHLEVFVPTSKKIVNMEGEVRWSEKEGSEASVKKRFNTGVHLRSVEGQLVQETVYYDEVYKIVWSAVLESILGTFRKAVQEKS